MPTKAEVFNAVKDLIAKFTNRDVSKIKEEFNLQKHPLKMDSPKLNFLTLSLRGYIKNFSPNQTILAAEVKKANLTVKGLCELVNTKINGKNS